MFEFEDGQKITYAEMATLIRQEPNGLCQYTGFNSKHERCTIGVIRDMALVEGHITCRRILQDYYKFATIYRQHWGETIINDNDNFMGTNQARAEYIAQRIEVLPSC